MLTSKSFKPALFVPLVFLLIISFSSMASAGGWWRASVSDPIGSEAWDAMPENGSYGSPHGGYVTTSNLCKTCHAVHGAEISSYRLLKDGSAAETRTQGELIGQNGMGNKRSTECMYCHDATAGVTSKKPYAAALITTVRGEHTLGSTSIPDSNINGGSGDQGNLFNRNPVAYGGNGAELDCYQCHSVHGANTIGFDVDNNGSLDPVSLDGNIYDSADDVESWNNKILRLDPSGDGNPLGKGGTSGIDATELANQPTAVRTGFCGDCHDANPNWVTTTDTVGPNKRSHIQGRGADGIMEVYGNNVAVAAHKGEVQGCRGCHAASDGTNLTGDSNFPHQSVGWKLMWDSYQDEGQVDLAGDPARTLPKMDRTCLMCHPVDDEFESGKDYSDVATEQNLCFRCHKLNSYAGAPDVDTEIAKAYAHPTNSVSGKHVSDTNETTGELGGANRHAECLDCHNTEKVVQGQGQALRGIWGVSVTNGASGTAPAYTKTTAVAAEYELCFKCHSSYVAQRANTTYSGPAIYEFPVGIDLGQGNKALEFNTNNNAFHPVEGSGRNQSSNLNAQLASAGLDTNSTIKCSDCHNSDITSDALGSASNSSSKPKGAHGSTNRPLLRANYYLGIQGPSTWNANNFKLCFSCHDETALTAQTIALGARTNFYKNSSLNRNLHWLHTKNLPNMPPFGAKYNEAAVCRNCHYNVHSNQQAANTLYSYFPLGGGGWLGGTGTPPNGVKTHMVNFSPDIEDAGGGGTPTWAINMDSVEQSLVPAGSRACQLRCHTSKVGTPGFTKDMDISWAWYRPSDGVDDDVPTY